MNRSKPRVTTALLDRRAKALKRHLPSAIKGDGIGVHQARVASRRLREAVPVLGVDVEDSGPRKAGRKIRRLTRALGAVRELDVTITVLDELAARDTLPRVALEEVRGHVIEERERRRATMLERLDRVNIAKLERRLAGVAEALEETRSEDWRKALGTRIVKRARGLGKAIEDAGQMYSPERLHQVRIATKKLRYSLEIAAETGARAAVAPVRQLKRTQDDLGRLHDLQVLQEHVAAVQERAPGTRLQDGLAVVARMLEDECRHLHGRYVAATARLLECVDVSRRVVVPQLARGARRRSAPIKMSLAERRPRAQAANGTTRGRR